MVAFLALLISCTSFAAQSGSSNSGTGATLRLLGGGASVKPADVNESFQSQQLQKVSASLLLGGEIGYTFGKFGLGFRYLNNQVSRNEEPDIPNTVYTGSISQDIMMAMAHISLLKKDYVQFELFGGYGSASSRIKVKSSTQKGELNRGMFNSAVSTAGASLALGYKNFFITFEGGYMGNKATNFSRSGTINDDIQTLDLSGTYAMVGLLFYGSGIGGIIDGIGRATGSSGK